MRACGPMGPNDWKPHHQAQGCAGLMMAAALTAAIALVVALVIWVI